MSNSIINIIIRLFFKISIKLKKSLDKHNLDYQNFAHYKVLTSGDGKIGKGVKFGKNVNISGISSVSIGNNVHIGTGCFFRGEGGLEIGDNVIISRNVIIYTTSHNYEGELLPFDSSFKKNKVTIGKNVWIGMNVTIAPGTKIGEGAIIGLGARVYGEIPPLAIVGIENPKIIKYRDKEHYLNLETNKKYAKENGIPLNEDE